MPSIAIVGAGLIGRSWSIVFARAGMPVSVWDPEEPVRAGFAAQVLSSLGALEASGLLAESSSTVAARIRVAASLADAVATADYVQESAPEQVAIKTALFATIDDAAPADAVLASSTSTIPASAFTGALRGRHRCVIAHPVNPPHLVPAVEIVPAPWTSDDVVARATALQAAAGQVPVMLRREVDGFIVNRLQAALLLEAWRLVGEGYCTVEDVDKCVRDGLGLRWAFMGPFETIDLNAPGGIADYAARYGGPMHQAMKGVRYTPWAGDLVTQVEAQRREVLPEAQLRERAAWRDRRLMALAGHRRAMQRQESD